jgi:hypothetical protein
VKPGYLALLSEFPIPTVDIESDAGMLNEDGGTIDLHPCEEMDVHWPKNEERSSLCRLQNHSVVHGLMVAPRTLLCYNGRKPGAMSLLRFLIPTAYAKSVYDGCGFKCGMDYFANLAGLVSPSTDPRTAVIAIVKTVLNWLSLVAVIMIIIAGIYLLVSLGEDEKREKAKKIIIYTLVGLIVIILAQILVNLVTVVLYSTIA